MSSNPHDFTVNMVTINAALDAVTTKLAGVIPDSPLPIGRICKEVIASSCDPPTDKVGVAAMSESEWRLVGWALRAARHASVIPAMQGNERDLLR